MKCCVPHYMNSHTAKFAGMIVHSEVCTMTLYGSVRRCRLYLLTKVYNCTHIILLQLLPLTPSALTILLMSRIVTITITLAIIIRTKSIITIAVMQVENSQFHLNKRNSHILVIMKMYMYLNRLLINLLAQTKIKVHLLNLTYPMLTQIRMVVKQILRTLTKRVRE